MQIIKQGTSAPIYVYLVDLTDGYTPETGITAPVVYLAKNGGTPAVPSSLAWAELDSTNMPGWYKITLSATDTDTPGPLGFDVFKTGVARRFAGVAQVYSYSQSDIYALLSLVYTDTHTNGVLVATAARALIADDVWDELLSGHTVTGSAGKQLSTASSAGDPWASVVGAYAVGTAGNALYRVTQGAGANLLTVTILDLEDRPVDGAKVDVYSTNTPTSNTFVTSGHTNASGVVNFYLRNGTYYYWVYKRGWTGASFGQGVMVTVP